MKMKINKIKKLLDISDRREEGLRLLRQSTYRNIPSLASKYLSDNDEFVRDEALMCLIEKGNKRYITKIIPLLQDNSEIVRISAIQAFEIYANRNMSKYLYPLLNDSCSLVRGYAARTLGELFNHDSISFLKNRLLIEDKIEAKAGIFMSLYILTEEENYLKKLFNIFSKSDGEITCFVARTLVSVVYFDIELKEEVYGNIQGMLNKEKYAGVIECLNDVLSDINKITNPL